jgi:hypothetical protein
MSALGLTALACLAVAAPRAFGQEFERQFSFATSELRIANLIGEIKVRGHSGDQFEVTVRVRGEDASGDLVRFEESSGREGELLIRFPTDEHRRYVYPEMGRNSRTRFRPRKRDGSWLGRMLDLGSREIEVRGRAFRDAIEVWADLEVLVPEGKPVAIHLGVGAMNASDVKADLELDTHSGAIDVDQLRGDLLVDTGSGSVFVGRVTGNVDVDTGSGGVEVNDVEGAETVRVDTGSGSVTAMGIQAQDLNIDTGSGSVELDEIRVDALAIDTGSGGIDATGIETNGAIIDTGSGGVRLELTRMGQGRYEVDTGSGGIRLTLPREISAEFDVDTGSGGINVDIDGVQLPRKPRGEARFTVGDGDSQVRLSTGSGSVRIKQGRG